jgi:hypothetical protein
MTQLSEIDIDVLKAPGEPRPMFVVIRPTASVLTPEVVEHIQRQWQMLVDKHPDLPPAVCLPRGWDIEAVYPPKVPTENSSE